MRLGRWLTVALVGLIGLYVAGVGTLYVFQRDFLFIGAVRANNAPPPPPGYRDVRMAATDGTPLRAWFKPPALGKPVVLFFHGNGDTIAGSAAAVQPFTDRGYGALLPEYRGYGGMPGRPSEAVLAADARVAQHWLARMGVTDARTVLMGYSLGSGVATQLAVEIRPGALILFAGYASIDQVAAARFWFVPVRWLLKDHFDTASKLSKVTAPVLLLHGTADRTVPFDNLALLKRARSDAASVTFPNIGHNLVYLPEVSGRAIAWLDMLGASKTARAELPL
ncbi:MAG: alpha/beta hydrolase [Sphingomonas sp.]|nr:alpha/beta hydrolase [Sphingomonas sp.]